VPLSTGEAPIPHRLAGERSVYCQDRSLRVCPMVGV